MSRHIIALIATAAAVLSSHAAIAAVPIWRFDAQHNQLDLQLDQAVQPQARLVSNPARLVIDLPGIYLGQRSFTAPLTNDVVRAIRFGQFEAGTTRVVVELAPGYTIDPQQVRFRPISSRHWTIDIPPAIPVASSLPEVGAADVAIAVPILPPAALSLPVPDSGTGQFVVVIDPGHGGPDPGAVGIGGMREKDIVLDIAQQLASKLRGQGIKVVMTRDADIDLDLEPRVALAERVKANFFVSIHANSLNMSRPDVNGLQTYYFHNNSSRLAQVIQQEVLQTTGIVDRGVKTARFYVIRNTSMPAVLVEVGFVTGRDDAAHLADINYRAKTADAIATGILRLGGLTNATSGGGIVTGRSSQ